MAQQSYHSYGAWPVHVVSSHISSPLGKTTLLHHILTANHGKRIAVLLNDFGDSVGMERTALTYSRPVDTSVAGDTTAVQSQPPIEEWIELRNGCLCCSVKDAGVKAIENLLEKRGTFDYILIETTGLSDPVPIAAMFWLDGELYERRAWNMSA